MLNDVSEILVLSIGLGVGVAAIIGVLRSLRGWSLKPLIAIRYSRSAHALSNSKDRDENRQQKMSVDDAKNSVAAQMLAIAM